MLDPTKATKSICQIPPILHRWSVITTGVILLAGAMLKWNASLMPDVALIPEPRIPLPNAFDYFESAASMLTEVNIMRFDGIKPTVDTVVEPQGRRQNPRTAYDIPRELTIAERQKFVDKDAVAFELASHGLKAGYAPPVLASFRQRVPYLVGDRAICHMIVFKGETFARVGRWSQALASSLDAMQLGATIMRGSSLIGPDCGQRCQGEARRLGYIVMPNLTAMECRNGAMRLEKIDDHTLSASQYLCDCKIENIRCLRSLFKARTWRREALADFGYINFTLTDIRDEPTLIKLVVAFELSSPRSILNSAEEYDDTLSNFLQLPWPKIKVEKLPPMPLEAGCVEYAFYPLNKSVMFKRNCSLALNRLLELQLALRAFNMDHGHYPASLTELRPRYIRCEPFDPFSNNAFFIYSPSAKSYKLYSIGQDAVDDGGKPIDHGQDWKRYRFQAATFSDSTGDIVAGVND